MPGERCSLLWHLNVPQVEGPVLGEVFGCALDVSQVAEATLAPFARTTNNAFSNRC